MPKKKQKAKFTMKRSGANKWSEGSQNQTLNQQGLGMPDRYETTLRYSKNFTLSGTGTGAAQVYNLNSLFDPDRSGVGTQPQNFDQIAAFYGTYWVSGCRWTVEMVNGNSVLTDVATLVSDDASTVDYPDMIMNPRSYKKILALNSSGECRAKFSGYTKMATLHGQRYIEADNEDFAAVTASPTDTAVLIIDAQAHDGSNAYSVAGIVTLDYDCVFMGRKRTTPSLLSDKDQVCGKGMNKAQSPRSETQNRAEPRNGIESSDLLMEFQAFLNREKKPP